MSVFVMFKIPADADRVKEVLAGHSDELTSASARSREMGALHHMFATDGHAVYVVDEWASAEAFQEFFSSTPEVGTIMAEAGVTGPPDVMIFEQVPAAGSF